MGRRALGVLGQHLRGQHSNTEGKEMPVWDMRGVVQPDPAHTCCKTSDTYQVLLATAGQTAPKQDFKDVNFGLRV